MRALLVIALVACGSKSPKTGATTQPSGPVLYDRIGRMDAIKGIVKDFVEEQLLKGALATRFTNVNAAQLEDNLSTQLCELSGGPCKYTGRSMKDSHQHLNITQAQWDAMAADFRATLNKFKVPQKEQQELIAIVESTKPDIVQAPGARQR